MKIAFHGQRGSYAEAAAAWMFADQDIATVPTGSAQGVVDALLAGAVQMAVLRFENTETGTNYDLLDLLRHKRLFFSRETRFHERYNLAGARTATRKSIKRLLSHPTLFHLCSNYLSRQQGLDIIARFDTAEAFMTVATRATPEEAVVCGDFAASIYGLSIIEAGIENNAASMTRFIALGPDLLAPQANAGAVHTAVMFELKHEAGALMEALGAFKKYGINLDVVTGRPNRAGGREYTIYVEFAGCHSDDANKKALAELAKFTSYLQVLGSFDIVMPRIKKA